MRETLLSVHRAVDRSKPSNNKKGIGTYYNNLSIANGRTDIEIEVEHILPHLDLAIGNNIQPNQNFLSKNLRVSCPNLGKNCSLTHLRQSSNLFYEAS